MDYFVTWAIVSSLSESVLNASAVTIAPTSSHIIPYFRDTLAHTAVRMGRRKLLPLLSMYHRNIFPLLHASGVLQALSQIQCMHWNTNNVKKKTSRTFFFFWHIDANDSQHAPATLLSFLFWRMCGALRTVCLLARWEHCPHRLKCTDGLWIGKSTPTGTCVDNSIH